MINKVILAATAGLMAVSLSARAEDLVLEPGRVEVVVAPRAASATRYAATELTNFLSRVLGSPVPVRVKSVPGAVYIVGAGDAAEYGVYGFLQREADCRFFFPGELGEIVRPGGDLPLQKLDYQANLDPLACYIASCRAEDGFARHLDFCVRRTEKLPPSVNPGVFYGAYMNRMFGRGNTSWYMGQFFAGKSPEKMLKHAGDDAPKDDPLVRRRVELFCRGQK